MRRESVKFVLRFLIREQNENRVSACKELKNCIEEDPDFMAHIITEKDKWIYGYITET